MPPRSRADAFAFGDKGDKLVRDLLRAGGSYVFANSDSTRGGAPMATGSDGSIIWPDLSVVGAGCSSFAEVKTKAGADWHRNSGKWVTGCELHCIRDYEDCQRKTGQKVSMVFVHVKQDEVLTQKLDVLLPGMRIDRSPGTIAWAGEPMAFFECDDFEVMAKLSECDALTMLAIKGHCPPKKSRPSSFHSEVPHAGKWTTKQANRYTDYTWVPDVIEIARQAAGPALEFGPEPPAIAARLDLLKRLHVAGVHLRIVGGLLTTEGAAPDAAISAAIRADAKGLLEHVQRRDAYLSNPVARRETEAAE